MKKNRYEIIQIIILKFLKPLVHIWMLFDMKRVVHKTDSVDFKRKEPYIMLANHVFIFDVIHVPLKFKKNPYIVASENLFVKQPTKFLFKWVVHVIPKSKGASDLRTAKGIISAKKKGFPILIFPEGDATFYGQTREIEYSTIKLIKKLGIDLIVCNVKGGFLSRPSWATGKRKRRQVDLFYDVVIKKEELKTLSISEISEIVTKALFNNDYDFQREHMIKHPGKDLAMGMENVVYVCPECEAINSIKTSGNQIKCNSCNTEGIMNQYGFIEGFKFDNLFDWDTYQRGFYDKIYNTRIESSGRLHYLSFEDSTKEYQGEVNIVSENGVLSLSGVVNEDIKIEDIKNPIITLRRNLSFTYNSKRYFIQLEQFGSSLLRVMQDKY